MAIPDPFTDELRIMSYGSRPRTCKNLYKLPCRNDFIEVLWCLDDLPGLPEKWCPAEVLDISERLTMEPETPNEAKHVLAQGIILYLPGETWEEQIDEVEFFDGHKLRCAVNEKEKTDSADDIGREPNLAIRWRFRELSSATTEEDEEWDISTSHKRPNSRQEAVLRARSNLGRNRRDDVELNALREGHASLTVEIEKLKRELVGMTRKIQMINTQTAQEQTCTIHIVSCPGCSTS